MVAERDCLCFTEGETAPIIEVAFEDIDEVTEEVTPIDLTDYGAITLRLRDEIGCLLTKTATVEDAPGGIVHFQFAADDLTEGLYKGDIEVIDDNADVEIVTLDCDRPICLRVRARV